MTTTSAAGIAWDLRDLYAGLDDPAIEKDLDAAQARAAKFEKAYRGKIAAAPTPALLAKALTEVEDLSEQVLRPLIYVSLDHAAKPDEPRHGARLGRTRERRTAITRHLIFFEL